MNSSDLYPVKLIPRLLPYVSGLRVAQWFPLWQAETLLGCSLTLLSVHPSLGRHAFIGRSIFIYIQAINKVMIIIGEPQSL